MCCKDGVSQQTAPPPPQELNQGPPCTSPDNLQGYCITVQKCPKILAEFQRRRNDPEYVRYIQQSNAICNYQRQAICCPLNDPQVQPTQPPPTQPPPPPPNNIGSRLAEPNQCGVSKVPHNR